MNLKNRTVVITGAAGGFGREMTFLFLKKSARVVALDLSSSGLKKLKQECDDAGFELVTKAVDVTKPEDFDLVLKDLAVHKMPPDVWINNAGIAIPKSFSETTSAEFEKVFRVNFDGVVYGTRAALKVMEGRQTGTIVNISSVSGHLPSPFLVSYSASKHAIVGFTRGLQIEYAQKASPLKFILVSPGFADTGIMKSSPDFALPKILSWSVSTPESVAKDVVRAVEKNHEEIFPGLSGAAMMRLFNYAPKRVFRFAARALTARNWKEFIGLEGIRSR